MINLLIERLKSLIAMDAREDMALRSRTDFVRQFFPARAHLFRYADRPTGIHLVLRGVLCRYSMLPDGRRRITAIHLPGDFVGVRSSFGLPLDHPVFALDCVETGFLPINCGDFAERMPLTCCALWLARETQLAILRQWLCNQSCSASTQVAHLLCELYVRLQALGLAQDGLANIPMTQIELADALAMTPVHVNRVLRQMARAGTATFIRSQLRILDWDRLVAIAQFDPAYLRTGSTLTWLENLRAHPLGVARVNGRGAGWSRPEELSRMHGAVATRPVSAAEERRPAPGRRLEHDGNWRP